MFSSFLTFIYKQLRVHWFINISEVLVSLHWLRIKQRIVYKILILTYKAFVDHSLLCNCRNYKIKRVSPQILGQRMLIFLLVIPPISRICSNTFFERSFHFASPTEWNKLDARIRCISNLNCFKREIKTILFLYYFDV